MFLKYEVIAYSHLKSINISKDKQLIALLTTDVIIKLNIVI